MSFPLLVLRVSALAYGISLLTALAYSMLAVMTMNVGYFMSVLGGTFLGSLLLGRLTLLPVH